MPVTSHNLTLSFNKFSFPTFYAEFPSRNPKHYLEFRQVPRINCAKKVKRRGKLRYPSEKKKLRQQQETKIDAATRLEGVWRISRLAVSVEDDPGKDFWDVSEALLREIAKILEFPVPSMLPPEAFTVVRKSFDARKLQKQPKFVYTVDMDVQKLLHLEPRTWEFISELEPKIGCLEFLQHDGASGDLMSIIRNHQKISETAPSGEIVPSNHVVGSDKFSPTRKPRIVVIGSGPSGLFASLVLAEVGADVTLIERGEAVEQRGRDIGALIVRRLLQVESNFCFGEVLGAMGSWLQELEEIIVVFCQF